MKRTFDGYDYLRRLKDCDMSILTKNELLLDSDEKQMNCNDSLLSIVYAPDERTGLPTGDLTYFVSDKANPQIKQFILDNLMQDVSSAKNVSAPADLDDDTILALSRGHNEDVQSYMERLNSSIERDKWMIDEYKKQLDVSAKSQSSAVSDE